MDYKERPYFSALGRQCCAPFPPLPTALPIIQTCLPVPITQAQSVTPTPLCPPAERAPALP